MACTINENLSKDLVVLQLSEALQGFSEGWKGQSRQQIDKEGGRKDVRQGD